MKSSETRNVAQAIIACRRNGGVSDGERDGLRSNGDQPGASRSHHLQTTQRGSPGSPADRGHGNLEDLLVERGYLTRQQLRNRKRQKVRGSVRLSDSLDLVRMGLITYGQLNECHRLARTAPQPTSVVELSNLRATSPKNSSRLYRRRARKSPAVASPRPGICFARASSTSKRSTNVTRSCVNRLESR
jgi:hypothetical protein